MVNTRNRVTANNAENNGERNNQDNRAPTNAVTHKFNMMRHAAPEYVESFMARFKYQGGTFDFTTSGNNDAPLPRHEDTPIDK
jgi:hypothetical protein